MKTIIFWYLYKVLIQIDNYENNNSCLDSNHLLIRLFK
jgi:hypothetical protein